MQRRYEPGADREAPENGLLAAFEMQARALVEMGYAPQVEARLRRVLDATGSGAPADWLDAADGLQLAGLLQALIAAERHVQGWRQKQQIQAGWQWLAERMRAAAKGAKGAGAGAQRERETEPA